MELPQKVRETIDEKKIGRTESAADGLCASERKTGSRRKTVEAQESPKRRKLSTAQSAIHICSGKYIETLKELVNSPNNSFVIAPYDQKLTQC